MVFILMIFMVAVLSFVWQYYVEFNNRGENAAVINLRSYKMKALFFAVLASLPIFLVYSLQSNMHSDYNIYLFRFMSIGSGITDDGAGTLVDQGPIITPIFHLVHILNLDFQFVYLFIYLIAFSILTKCIYDYSKNFSSSMILFFALFFTLGFLQIRQFLAVVVVFYSYRFINKGKFIPFLLTIAIAICFHISAIIMIPLFFILRTNFTLTAYCIVASILAALNIFSAQLNFWTTKTFFSKYLGRHEMTRSGEFDKTAAAFQIIILLIVLIYYKRAGDPHCLNRIFINAFFIQFIIFFTLRWIPELDRFMYYLFIGSIAMIPNLIATDENKPQRMLIQYAVPVIILFMFLYRQRNSDILFNYISVFSK